MACSLESGDHACLFVGSTSERLLLHELLEGLAEAQPVVVDAEGAGRPLGGDDRRTSVEVVPGGIRLAGVLDVTNVEKLADAVSTALAAPHDLHVDMSGFVFIDPGGLRLLYHPALRLATEGRRLVIASPPAPVATALQLLERAEHLRREPGEAIAQWAKRSSTTRP